MKKVLLTGATGYIGSQVTKELLNRGYEVHAIEHEAKLLPQDNLVVHKLDHGQTVPVMVLIRLDIHAEGVGVGKEWPQRLIQLLVDGDEAAKVLL